ncbi:hypothetical protein [Alkalimonas amylolytica]|uniref:Uncharacterized conserved protein YbjT, contains NAD(P)-binding and DUF2867 domains n=1 Tax=Alkalimonas amylolytica TaxID=152573 RepID=A0A1H3ZAJ7_ALKAM|nr:hypothetical protein [Alkalimonas amylolytica]SEA20776.1 Uncharacterized conserved protein YbjT, contains NAD(P)-binding and DUF2867 domains [Alkalimonas amylolytica]
MKVILLGATGLTGGHLLTGLLGCDAISRIYAPVRRPLGIEHPKLEAAVCDPTQWPALFPSWQADALLHCLGTTIKKAGSRQTFRAIDYQLPLQAADLAKAQGARFCLCVSAVGADANSGFFYNRVKGELEQSLAELGFQKLLIYRPGLLLGQRDEHRFAEQLASKLMPLLAFVLRGKASRYRAIAGSTVAKAILADLQQLAMHAQTADAATDTAKTEVSLRYFNEMQQLAAGANSA